MLYTTVLPAVHLQTADLGSSPRIEPDVGGRVRTKVWTQKKKLPEPTWKVFGICIRNTLLIFTDLVFIDFIYLFSILFRKYVVFLVFEFD